MNDTAAHEIETGDVAKDIGQRIAMMRHFTSTGQFPFMRRVDAVAPPHVNVEGDECIMLGSNSYTGLSNHPLVIAAAVKATEEFGVGTTGSRFLNGTYAPHIQLERTISDWLGQEDTVVFTSGYQANVGTIQGLLGPDCLAVVDSFAHASVRDGVRLSRAVEAKFAHNDPDSLAAVLRSHAGTQFRRRMVLIDSVYSMEGSTAPLEQMIAICKNAGALLMVDEAHGFGVFGQTGGGLSELSGVGEHIDILMGTLSKAIGSLGGFIATSQDLADEVRLNARSFMFSASGTPAAMAAAVVAIEIIRGEEGRLGRERLERNARLMRDSLAPLDVALHRPDERSPDWSPIIPIRLHDELHTLWTWKQLKDEGVFVTPVIYPAVPLGRPILRISMTAELSEEGVLLCTKTLTKELAWALETR